MAASRQKGTAGFASVNTGRITDCCSDFKMKQKEHLAGFCFSNEGTIARCAALGDFKADQDAAGFCVHQKGVLRNSFWLRRNAKRKSDLSLPDIGDAVLTEDAVPEFLSSLGWDTASVWQYEGGDKLHLYSKSETPPQTLRTVDISDRAALEEMAQQINDGLSDSRNTLYRLTADIDLRGSAWTPIGQDPSSPFRGYFDGNGHVIRNFHVRAPKNPYAGLFGCVGKEGEIHNLRVDCVILGFGSYSAPMAAQNEGRIVNCVTKACVDASRFSGGFVARNSGEIIRCSASGKTDMPLLFPWWLPAILMGLLMFSAAGIFTVQNIGKGVEVFAPVIIDPNARPIDPEDPGIPEPEPDNVTDSSACFIMNAEMAVSRENYAGTIGLRCPFWSNRGFVATATVSGEDLRRNGASFTEDAVVYQSGLIKPGMGLNIITLDALPDSSRLPVGDYELTVQFDFYDVDTNERSAVNSTAPLDVTVH